MLYDYVKVRKVHLNLANKAFGRTFDPPPVDESWFKCKDIHGKIDYITATDYFSACAKIERKHPECYTRAGKSERVNGTVRRDWSRDV